MKKFVSVSLTALQILVLPTLFVVIYYSQYQFDHERLLQLQNLKISENQLIAPDIINPNLLPKISFGMNNFLADLMWLETIQYFGGGNPNEKYNELPQMIKAILALDPKFSYPYTFAGLILPSEGFADQALSILSNGEKSLPKDWSLPYYEGTIQFIYKKNHLASAEDYQKASKLPGAPAMNLFLSAVQYDQNNNYQTAETIFSNIAKESSSTYFRQRAKLFIKHYELLSSLNNLTKNFYKKFDRYPTDLNELVQKKYLNSLPQDPLNRQLEYNAKTGAVTSPLSK